VSARESTVVVPAAMAAFTDFARSWLIARGHDEIYIKLHPWTWTELVVTRNVTLTDGGRRLMGMDLTQDACVPPGILRLVHRGHEWSLPIDVRAVNPRRFEPAGGSCEVAARCWKCPWSCIPPEGMTPEDALAAANFLAQEHRAETGHGVTVTASVNWATAAEEEVVCRKL
jgi:hypothetical protein